MKRFYLPVLSIICTIAMLSFTNAKKVNSKFICQWFMYDNPSVTDPSADFPNNLSEATTISNWVPATVAEVTDRCFKVKVICAICAEVDALGQPKLGSTENIVINHLVPYFNQTDPLLRVPNTSFIKEKFDF